MSIQNPRFLKYSNIIAFILMVVINGLAGSSTFIGGKLTAQISDANPTLITPAGYVFSIWGIIYVLLGIFVVYQALPSKQGSGFQKRISVLFVLSSLANIIWLFLWQFEYLAASIGLMFLLLACLIIIYLRLEIGKSNVSMGERLAVHLPFSVYLGWITIATIANIAVTLVSVNWDGAGIPAQTWAYFDCDCCTVNHISCHNYKKRYCICFSSYLGFSWHWSETSRKSCNCYINSDERINHSDIFSCCDCICQVERA